MTQTINNMIQLLSLMLRTNQLFLFLLIVAEANATNKEDEQGGKQKSQLEFLHALAQIMSFNNLVDEGRIFAQLECLKTQQAVETMSNVHHHKKRPFFTGIYGITKRYLKTSKD